MGPQKGRLLLMLQVLEVSRHSCLASTQQNVAGYTDRKNNVALSHSYCEDRHVGLKVCRPPLQFCRIFQFFFRAYFIYRVMTGVERERVFNSYLQEGQQGFLEVHCIFLWD
ncbi:hypothetical protein NPIL_170181 [Nephila pilipes]|uniref:Secreted protein n=1 Tax=Nephila pilipes TaxID=299642 RepID=A0A8X6NHL3_NEPPI|nr:hypothetical protein NPIL_170181 [Nephila pilipes]